jgi:FkbM family methyltransferase
MHRIINPFVYDYVRDNKMPNPTIPAWLDETYSQNYEDVVICPMINAYIRRNNLHSASFAYLEIGGNHPVCTSASFLLQKVYGMNGIIVEPDPKLAATLRQHRPNDYIIEAAVVDSDEKELEFFVSSQNELSTLSQNFVEKNHLNVQSIKVKTIRVNDLLKNFSNVDSLIMSIDVEGLDLRVLKDIDFNLYRPHIITIEPSEHIVPGTTSEIISFLKEKEYRLVAQNYVNLIFEDLRKS